MVPFHSTELDGPVPSVVIVDDDESARVLIARYLEELGLRNPMVPVEDGHLALEVLAAQPVPPALVLLDLRLPGVCGLEILTYLRHDHRLADVPVVMLTGSSELDDIDRAYELGISSYLVKPVGFPALADVVRKLGRPWVLVAPGVGV